MDGEDAEGQPIHLLTPILQCKISLPYVQEGPDALNFTTTRDKGNIGTVSIEFATLGSQNSLMTALVSQSVVFVTAMKKHIEDYFMSLLGKLQAAHTAISSVPYGWYKEKGVEAGFAYGGIIHRCDGGVQPAGRPDPKMRAKYDPTGQASPWFEAVKLVTDEKRPELDTIIASAFAGPLMPFTQQHGAMLHVYGQTGSHKSSALRCAAAVFGRPQLTVLKQDASHKAIINMASQLKNFTIYWDEIQDEIHLKKQKAVLHMAAEGGGGIYMKRDRTQADQESWDTMIVCAANASFVDYMVGKQKTTAAGLVRVLEYVCNRVPENAPGQIFQLDMDTALKKLEDNYGMVGQMYADFLAKNCIAVQKAVTAVHTDIIKATGSKQPERFWTALYAAIVTGAMLANTLGATLDVQAIKKFLHGVILANRERVKDEQLEGGTDDNTERQMTRFFKYCNNQEVYTDYATTGVKGRPPVIKVLHTPQFVRDALQVQWAVKAGLLLVSRDAIMDWCRTPLENIPPNHIFRGLKDHFGATTTQGSIAGGTPFAKGRETIFVIPVDAKSPFYEILMAFEPKPVVSVVASTPVSVLPSTGPSPRQLSQP